MMMLARIQVRNRKIAIAPVANALLPEKDASSRLTAAKTMAHIRPMSRPGMSACVSCQMALPPCSDTIVPR